MKGQLKYVGLLFALAIGFMLAFAFVGSKPKTNDLPASQFTDESPSKSVATPQAEPQPTAESVPSDRGSSGNSNQDNALAKLSQLEKQVIIENDSRLSESPPETTGVFPGDREPPQMQEEPVRQPKGQESATAQVEVPTVEEIRKQVEHQMKLVARDREKSQTAAGVLQQELERAKAADASAVGAFQDRLRQIQEENSRLLSEASQLIEIRRDNAALRNQLSQARAGAGDATAAKSKFTQLEEENRRLQGQLREQSALKQESLSVRNELETALREKKNLQAQLSGNEQKAHADRQAREQAMRQVLVDLQKEVAKTNKELGEASSTIGQLRAELQAAKQQVDTKKSQAADIAGLKEEREKLRARTTELERNLLAANQELTRLKPVETESADTKRRLETVTADKLTIEKDLRKGQERLKALETENAEIKRKLEALTTDKSKVEKDLQARVGIDAELAEKNREIQNLNRQISKTIEDTRALEARLELSERAVKQIPQLNSDIVRLQNLVLEKNAEIELLDKTQKNLTQGTSGVSNTAASRAPVSSLPPSPRPKGEVRVVIVRANKAYLRSAPGRDNSPIMDVQRGTRLTVETEEGDWLRVIAPTGARAYIQTELVANEGSPLAKVPLATDDIPIAPTPSAPRKRSLRGGISEGAMATEDDVTNKGSNDASEPDDDVLKAFENLKRGMSSGNR